MTARPAATPAGRAAPPGLTLAIDYLPLVVFFAFNFLVPSELAMRLVAPVSGFLSAIDRLAALVVARVILATAAFIAATLAAMAVSQWKLGRISPMLWISGGLVVVFGGLTIWFHNPNIIKMKPTFVYAIFAGTLLTGLVVRRPLLQALLGTAYPGLSDAGWTKLTRNWMLFFAGMAVLNELVWRSTAPNPGDDPNFWVGFKLWGAIPLTLLFALANIPMLLRHGLTLGAEPVGDVPPE